MDRYHTRRLYAITTDIISKEGGNKPIDTYGLYTYCDQCEWNGVPNQRIVLVHLGIRPTNEPGFIHRCETYDYPENGVRKIHRHKYDRVTIDKIIDQIFGRIQRIVK